MTVVIRPGRGWLGHVPGQYIRIGIDIDGVRHWRAYSLTHRADGSPAAGIPAGCVAITTKAIPDGKVSNHLVRATSAGTLVMLDQATGDFTLPTPAPAKVLFLTAGSGITPVMGMLRNHLAELSDVAHVHCAPTASEVIFEDELRRYAGDARLALTLNLDDEHGILDLSRLDAHVPDWRERETWLCGPAGLLDAAEAHWDAAGVAERLHTERFRPTVVEPGEGGHGHLPQERPRGRGGRQHAHPRRGRGGRHPHAERLPDGHLLRLRRDDAQRGHPRPAHR